MTLVVCDVLATAQISMTPDNSTMIVDDAPEMEVIAYGKNVVVKRSAKGVLAIGGDIVIEGRVEGDVATVGGSIRQLEQAYIGGDIFVLGGKYKPDSAAPLRNDQKETVMYAGYEDELRNLAQNPSQIFAPSLTLRFLAQRVLSVIFWFILSLALTTLAPGAISRAIARLNSSAIKVAGIGLAALVISSLAAIVGLNILANYLSAIIGMMIFVLLLLAYAFGRVALQVSTGQRLLKLFMPEYKRAESLAIFLGVVSWTLILSIPYVWTLGVITLFSAGIGLVITGRTTPRWKSS